MLSPCFTKPHACTGAKQKAGSRLRPDEGRSRTARHRHNAPGLSLNIRDAEQSALVQKFLREPIPFHFLPRRLRAVLLQFFLRNSMLAEGIRRSQDTFMTGMHTYLLKLGPDMLPTAYANPIDRRIAVSLPAVAVRLRVQDVAGLMAETAIASLSSSPSRSLTFLNIAGGPAIDSLNTLILLCKNHPGIFAEREIFLDISRPG